MKKIITDIEVLIDDVLNTDFEFNPTNTVPTTDKSGLTFESGEIKKGQEIETCVLYVDIRNSVNMIEKHWDKTMGKVYTAFTKSVIKSAHNHNGFVRNIIGDRVMIVFPSKDCFLNAVHCAVSINHICNYILPLKFPKVDFKCGIGIDFGRLRVIKVGVQKQGSEKEENRGLVWVGYPANIASRLTDVANKKIDETYFEIHKSKLVFKKVLGQLKLIDTSEKIELNADEFAEQIDSSDGHTVWIKEFDKMKSFSQKKRSLDVDPILVSEAVYNGYKKQNPNCNSFTNDWWTDLKYPIKNVKSKVYGGNFYWNTKE